MNDLEELKLQIIEENSKYGYADEQRAEFTRHLDSIRSERSIPAYERLLAAQGQNARSTDPRNVELLERVKVCLKEHDFIEATKLLNELT